MLNLFFNAELGDDLFEGGGDGCAGVVFGGEDEILGFEEAGEGGGSQAERAEKDNGIEKIRVWTGLCQDAAGECTEEVDLVGEVDWLGGFEVLEVTLFEVGGIKAMFESIAVAELAASGATMATTTGKRRGRFWVVDCQ
jgi:hypothetical protein